MQKTKKLVIVFVLAGLFFVALYLSLFAGYKDTGVNLFAHLFNLHNSQDSLILNFVRAPRVIKAIVAGVCLALSGLFMQTLTKNPLAEPYITGVSSGAGLAIVLSMIFNIPTNCYSLFGFLGSIASSLIVISFAGFNRLSLAKLILIGLSVNIFVSSLISLIILTNSDKAYTMMLILSGGLTNSSILSDNALMALFAVSVAVSALIIPKLNFIRLDSDLVSSFSRTKNIYTVVITIISAFLASLSVFAAGILGFIGIIIPQVSRLLIGQDYRWLFVVNVLLGSTFLLFADFISRVTFYPLEIPLGLVVAFLGAPMFVFFLVKKGRCFYD